MDGIRDLLNDAVQRITDEPDPLTRCRLAHDVLTAADQATKALAPIRQEAVDTLTGKSGTMTAAALASILNISATRVGQIRTSGPGPEAALFTDNPDQEAVITAVQKYETERGAPAVAQLTADAIHELRRALTALDRETRVEYVPPPGLVDLNRPGLIVPMGPRTSVLVRQAISADHHLTWKQGDDGHWHIVDTDTGRVFRSDFDAGPNGGTHCYAHVGRLRRPDQRGSFLYVGGIHAPGTAGALRYLATHAADIWDRVKRGNWSLVVQTIVEDDGTLTVTEATPLYLHKR